MKGSNPTVEVFILVFCALVAGIAPAAAAQCATITDHGSYVTADVELGTPGQQFAAIVDTGSNALTVPSCECVSVGFCDNMSRCFEGTNSTTYAAQLGPYGVPPSIKMVFGSGPVFASISSDVVHIGGVQANMQDAVYVITGHALELESKFEGILGMGLPSAYQLPNSGDEKHQIFLSTGDPQNTTFEYPSGFQGMEVTSAASLLQLPRSTRSHTISLSESRQSNVSLYNVNIAGFVEKAGIQRVAICLKNEAPGVMNFQVPPAPLVHTSIGRVHWGLDFRGASVGSKDVPVSFCTDQEAVGIRKTPCGAVIDTGSTSFRAPGPHIAAMYELICDQWPRCVANHTAYVQELAQSGEKMPAAQMSKGLVFKSLLLDCRAWWVQNVGLDELPKLYFHLRGAYGTSQSLEIHGWSYVVEQLASESEDMQGIDPTSGASECVPAFRPMEYNTDENGPVWVLGMPLFYEYQVGFDHAAWPPGIFFEEMECNPCESQTGLAVAQSQTLTHHSSGAQRLPGSQQKEVGASRAGSSSRHVAVLGGRRPRRIVGKFREPVFDTTKPL